MTSKKKTPKKRNYEKMDQLDHILHRPDTYIGAINELEKEDIFIGDISSEEPKVIFKNSVKISDAIVRIFVEILSNAIDNIHRSNEDGVDMNKIKININRETNEISIYNDGTSIPINIHEKEKTRIPELIFGNLLTSDNYDDSEERFRSGRNGFGAKLTNIFSSQFLLEIVHLDEDGCYYSYKQAWRNNMKEVSKPKIKEVAEQTPYTKISWIPDFKIFGGDGYNDTTISMYYRLIYDSAMIASFHKVSVYLNNKRVPIKSLTDYAKLFETTEEMIEFKTKDSNVVLCSSTSGFKHIAFTNGIFNIEGGVHVNKWCNEIFKPILAKFNKKNKIQITVKDIQKYFKIFINCNLPNPRFKSQSKHCLSGPMPTVKVQEKQLKAIMKWSFVDKVNDFIESKDLMSLKRKERKSKTFKSIPGYDPANNAGTKHSKKCTLILTEGLSAKTYAVRGIEKGFNNLKGRDWYGIFPLKGKLLNVRNCKSSDIAKNSEITNAMNAVGLQVGVDYTKEENFEKLNYGKLCMLCDQDVDGLHIQGLIINFIHKLFPTLLQRKESFVISMDTPLVRVFDKKTTKIFYSEKVFKEFIKDPKNKKMSRKYHKGLGTSSNKEVLETFGERMLDYKTDEKTDENINMLFDKKNANQRKKWLADNTADEVDDIDEEATAITFSEFIDKRMIQFSTDDCSRSIPNLFDGLKESQRKILYSVFLKNLNFSGKTLKVAQLAGYVAEKSAYHHGEQCLNDTIVKLANDIVGYNNIPLLFRDGQFATRLSGKDAAAGRYIFTKLDKLTRLIFPLVDDNLLDYKYEDGEKIEPKFYVPILPNILANGSTGIGTGWSSSVPLYNPLELSKACRQWMDSKFDDVEEPMPWYRNFKGIIEKISKNKFISKGVLTRSGNKVEIAELPIGVWTDKYKLFLEGLLENKLIKSMKNYSTPQEVRFVIMEHKNGIKCNLDNMKLTSPITNSNMVLFLENKKLKKFGSVKEIIHEFSIRRLKLYDDRKAYLLKNNEYQKSVAENKKRFLEYVINKKLVIYMKPEQEIIKQLEKHGFDKKGKNNNYEYILSMDMRSFTKEKIDKLQEEIDKLTNILESITKTSSKRMWKTELTKFEQEYKKTI